MKTDIILQGPIYSFTEEIVNHYLSLSFVNKIIVSCWSNDRDLLITDSRVTVVKTDTTSVGNPGPGNVNYQIQTTRTGLAYSTAEIIIKIRTDQQYDISDMWMMHNYFSQKYATKTVKLTGKSPKGRIFVAGMFGQLPYHPKDHLFWGFREDIEELFTIPFSDELNHYPTIAKNVRAETYLGAWYFSLFSEKAKKHLLLFEDYLKDGSPFRSEAMDEYKQLRDEIFGSFPRVRLVWKKQGINSYVYLGPPEYGEYWGT